MAFKQPYNNFNKQGASIAPAAAAVPVAAKGIGALLVKLGIKKGVAAGSKVALSKGGSFLAKLGKGKASSLVGLTQPKQGFVKQASSKISKGYNQKISDLAKNLGENKGDVDKFVKNKAMDAASNIVSNIGSKNNETPNPNTSEKTTIINTPSVETKEPKSYGYGNPQGPSQGYSDPTSISKSDEAVNAITPKKDDFISNFHAPVNVRGITFDAGDAVRAGRLLYNTIKDRNRSSRFKDLNKPYSEAKRNVDKMLDEHGTTLKPSLKYERPQEPDTPTDRFTTKKGIGSKKQQERIKNFVAYDESKSYSAKLKKKKDAKNDKLYDKLATKASANRSKELKKISKTDNKKEKLYERLATKASKKRSKELKKDKNLIAGE